MRLRLLFTVIIALFSVAVLRTSSNSQQGPAAPLPTLSAKQSQLTLPTSVLNVELKSSRGASFRLSDYSGQVLVINLWATWCTPCRQQVDSLVKLHTQFHSKQVKIVGLSTENPEASAEVVGNFISDFGVNYEMGWATTEVATTLMNGRDAIPQTFVISRYGRIVKRFVGFHPKATPPQLEQAIKEALDDEDDPPE